jgi:uncharacterized damage-inducible protein DinB
MQLTDLFLAELDREADRTRRTLERVPEGRHDWKPHPKSMALGYLGALIATLPTWLVMIINQDELDLQPPSGKKYSMAEWKTAGDLVEIHDRGVEQARQAFRNTNDEYLLTTNWKLLVAGNVVGDDPRHVVLRETINHLAHHRGQLTVYLRLNDKPVPAIYGPSADEKKF